MKQTKHILLTAALLLSSLMTSAHDFEVNGIYYNITSSADLTVEVTRKGNSPSYSGAVTIPPTVFYNSKTYRVTSIGDYAFYCCSSLVSATIPEGITSLPEYAFQFCSSLESLSLPESLTTIGHAAVSHCSALKNLTIPDKVHTIGNYAFDQNGFTAIVIPANVTSIGELAFYGCSNLKTVINLSNLDIEAGSDSHGCVALYADKVWTPQPLIESGEYYLYNVEEKKFLSRGEHWGTCATVDRYGIPFVWSAEEYSLKFLDSGVCLFETNDSHIYTDNNSTKFAFEEAEGGYLLNSLKSGRYLTIVYDAHTNQMVNVTNNATLATLWLPMTKAEHDAIVDSYVKENYTSVIAAAGISATSATAGSFVNYLSTLATEDKTSAVGTAHFAGNAGDWTFTKIRNQDSQPAYGTDFCELWQATGYHTQTITGLPEGIYKVTMQGFERSGGWKQCNDLAAYEYEITTATLSANGEEVNLKSWYSGKSGDSNPNNTGEAVAKFNEGQYMNEVYTYVGEDGTLTITVNKPSYVDDNWVLFNNFTLTHYKVIKADKKWDFDEATGHLYVNDDYDCNITEYPWNSVRDAITSIELGPNVTGIGTYAFYDCSSLTSITIPENSQLTSIGYGAFYNCNHLTSIDIPEGVTSIGDYAFANCSLLHKVINYSNLPLSAGSSDYGYVAYYAAQVIKGSELTTVGDFQFRTSNGVNYLANYIGQGTDVVLPDNYNEASYDIGNAAFCGCYKLITITIPEGVTNIGDYAFNRCSSLTSITIPENSQLTSIGNSAFFNCNHLTAITIPENVTSIGDYAFNRCSSLTSITIPASVTNIGNYAFYGCSSLTSITIPEGVTNIGDGAFACGNLTSITVDEGNTVYDSRNGCNAIIETSSNTLIAGCAATVIPENITSIGNSAFSGYSSLTSITIPESVTSIGYGAFSACNHLTAITIPENVTSIGDYAFNRCSSLTSIDIPEGVTSIGVQAFCWCSSLTSITLPESVTSIGNYAFYNCSKLTTITIPEGVTSIGYGAFDGCSSLTTITLPESVTSIGDNAFYNCSSLTTITLPESVTSIGYGAFSACNHLTSITCHAVVPPTCAAYAFYGVNTSIPVYVPETSVADYQSAEGWKDFLNFVGIDTGIDNSEIKNEKSEMIFDLNGHRVMNSENLKGIYIVNGKKTVIK